MARPARSLVGFMDEAQAKNYLLHACTVPTEAEALKCWNDAKDLLRSRPKPAKRPGKPEIKDMDAQYVPYLQQVQAYPGFLAHLGGLPWSFKLVEIDPLLSFQSQAIADVSDSHSARYQASGRFEDILEACLPATPAEIPVRFAQDASSLTIYSSDLNLRLQGPTSGQNPITGHQVAGFSWGNSFPLVQVARYQGRCFLRNGYHRTVSFARLGVTHIPCIFLDVPDYLQTGGENQGQFPQTLMMGSNPPTVGHLASDHSYVVPLRAHMRIIRITATELDVPVDI